MKYFGAFICLIYATSAHCGVVEDLRAHSPEASIKLRQDLTVAIWGTPTPNVSAVTQLGADEVDAVSTLGRQPDELGWLVYDFENGLKAKSLYVTFQNSACLFIVNAGHSQGFTLPPPADLKMPVAWWAVKGSVEFLKKLAAAKCDLLLSSMPLYGENRNYAREVGLPVEPSDRNLHNDIPHIPSLKPKTGSPLQYFLSPVIGALNWVLARKNYDRIGMAGLSGGGWTTTMIAALDPRIQFSYSVAGSLPVALRDEASMGDWEQRTPDLLNVADYSDLYLMGIAEKSRRTRLFFNETDSCCFQGHYARAFAPDLIEFSERAGYGALNFYIAPSRAHDIHASTAELILSDFLGDDTKHSWAGLR